MSRLSTLSLLVVGVVWAALAQPQVTVTYLANEGFLLEGGGRKVLIDALSGNGLSGYEVVPEAMREQLESAQAPFDSVDLVLATHHHGDHFDAKAVARFLRSSPGTRFVSTEQAVRLLHEEGLEEERIRGYWPPEGEPVRVDLNGVAVEVLNLHHGRGRSPAVQNLGFVLDLAGLRVLHIGDTEGTVADFKKYYGAGKWEPDLALLPVWYLTYPEWVSVVREIIQPGQIIGMHLSPPGTPSRYFGPDGSYEKRVKAIRSNFPDAHLPTNPGDSYKSP